MRRKNRLIAVLFCFGVALGTIILMAFGLFNLEIVSWVIGICIGWALRDSLEPLEKEIENNAEKVE